MTKNIGVLGCKLVFENETVQHNGLEYFKLPQLGDLGLIDHPGKGMPSWMAGDLGFMEVIAVPLDQRRPNVNVSWQQV